MADITWTNESNKASEKSKQQLANAVMLHHPDANAKTLNVHIEKCSHHLLPIFWIMIPSSKKAEKAEPTQTGKSIKAFEGSKQQLANSAMLHQPDPNAKLANPLSVNMWKKFPIEKCSHRLQSICSKMAKISADIMELNMRVLIEPRGFIRIIQLVMAIFAFATTAGFETVAKFVIICKNFEKDVQYKFGYPFRRANVKLRVPEKCGDIWVISFKTYTFPFDFSSNAEFFVAAGVLSLMFTAGIIFVYVFMHRLYSTNPITPVVDLMATGVLSIFWFAGSCAWAKGVSDIKYYTNPNNLFDAIDICTEPQVCQTISPGNFAFLNVSLIFGFGNCMLWISSLWFVYKETSFHQQIQPPAMLSQMGQQQALPMQEQDLKMGGQYEYQNCNAVD